MPPRRRRRPRRVRHRTPHRHKSDQRDPEMKQDLFEKLPLEITVNILSRLPVRSVVRCKCVCKPWLQLVGTREFVKSHYSKSVPAMLVNVHLEQSKLYKIFEFDDGLHLRRHDLHYNPITNFTLPNHGKIYGTVNGLVLLRDKSLNPDGLFICNPITREYIKLPCPQEFECSDKHVVAYGFGVSKISEQHKVVRICHECHKEGIGDYRITAPEWQVYTLGTGSWRRIAPYGPTPTYVYACPSFLATRNFATFLNGRLHWLVYDSDCRPWISCFDVETETFFVMSTPLSCEGSRRGTSALCAFEDSLSFCDDDYSTTPEGELVVWSVKGDGDENFWVKILVLRRNPDFFPFKFMIGLVFPLKVFKDGDMLFEWDGCFLFRYCDKDKRKPFDLFCTWHEAIIHTPSFLSLKSFHAEEEDVSTF